MRGRRPRAGWGSPWTWAGRSTSCIPWRASLATGVEQGREVLEAGLIERAHALGRLGLRLAGCRPEPSEELEGAGSGRAGDHAKPAQVIREGNGARDDHVGVFPCRGVERHEPLRELSVACGSSRSIVISPPACWATNPTMSWLGNGQLCLPMYWMSFTSTPTSSFTSRATAPSSDSPLSTNPATSA